MSKLQHLPEPYPGECLYSYLVRIHNRSVNAHWPTTCVDLFGTDKIQFSPYMYYHFRDLADHTGLPEDLILKMSGAAFYLSFLNRDCQAAAKKAILGNNPDAWSMLGIKRNPKVMKKALYYCPECMREDYARYGTPYFHTLHQLEGVRACPKHGCCLEVYPTMKVTGSTLVRFEPTDANAVSADDTDISIAKLADEVLNTEGLSRELLVNRYILEADRRGMRQATGSVLSASLPDRLGMERNEKMRLFSTGSANVIPFRHLQLWLEWGLHASDFLTDIPEPDKDEGPGFSCPICGRSLTHLSHTVERGRQRDTWHCPDCDLYANSYDEYFHIEQYGQKFLDWLREQEKAGLNHNEIERACPFSREVVSRLLRTGDATPVTDRLRDMESPDTTCKRTKVMTYTRFYDPNWNAAHHQNPGGNGNRTVDREAQGADLIRKAEAIYPKLCKRKDAITMKSICREIGISYSIALKTKVPAFYDYLKRHAEHGDDRLRRLVMNYILSRKKAGLPVTVQGVKENVTKNYRLTNGEIQKMIVEIYGDSTP